MEIHAIFLLFSVFIFKSTKGENSKEISADYYFGVGVLRSRDLSNPCKDSNFQILCHLKCGGGDHICLDGKCFCFTALTSSYKLLPGQTETRLIDSGEVSDYESEDVDEADLTKFKLGYMSQSALRHQIAHFCSNLSIARKCITKCLEEGKPAFCGKDHVCYCGHAETHSHATGKKGNVDAYAEFKDMYNKYLLGLGLEAAPQQK